MCVELVPDKRINGHTNKFKRHRRSLMRRRNRLRMKLKHMCGNSEVEEKIIETEKQIVNSHDDERDDEENRALNKLRKIQIISFDTQRNLQ